MEAPSPNNKNFYENSAEYPAIHGGDECGEGVMGDEIPLHVFQEAPPFKAGSFTLIKD
jgi:hypothetical protein